MIAALEASIGRSHRITPLLCIRYLLAWQADCVRRRQRVTDLRRDHHGGAGN